MTKLAKIFTRYKKNFESVILISIGNVLRLLNDHNSMIAKLFCLVPWYCRWGSELLLLRVELTPWFMTRWCTTVIAWWELCFLFALLSQFPLIYDEPCAALAGCWSCFSWCSSSSSQGVPGILTSKISLRNKESRGCKERKKKVKCTTFQIHLSVFWKIMRLKNALLWSKIRERETLSFPKISFSCHRLAGARMVVYEKWWSHFGMFIKNRGLLL